MVGFLLVKSIGSAKTEFTRNDVFNYKIYTNLKFLARNI